MGGSDQWGNIVTGTEFIRRKQNGEAYALTSPLIERSDGKKFGKSEEGNIWLDPQKTSPYKMYQYWYNVSDADAEKYIKIFTFLTADEIAGLIAEHQKSPHLRILQKKIAEEITIMVHSKTDLDSVIDASSILFGEGTTDTIKKIDEQTFLNIFEGVPLFEIDYNTIQNKVELSVLLVEKTRIFDSKGELRRLVQAGGLSINKEKIRDIDLIINDKDLINNKYLLVQKGKKNYYLIKSI